MIFSEHFQINPVYRDDWFDPILDRDTKLFIDPFFVFKTQNEIFKNSHTKIVNFFLEAFKLAAISTESREDLRYRLLRGTMVFPEAKEICLGYGVDSIDGAGSGYGFSSLIVAAIYESIRLGIDNINHFEQLGIFNEGIGCDRISDITANIIKKELIEYTLSVCERHHVPVFPIKIEHYDYDFQFKKWTSQTVNLPLNPYKKKLPILLVPSEFLGQLPTISTEDFWNYCWENKNEDIRDQFNIVVKNEVRKSDVIKIARQHRDWVKEYEEFREAEQKPDSYDFDKDPKGLYQWDASTRRFVNTYPLEFNITNENEFLLFSESIVNQFIHFIENNSGYRLLWNDDTNRPKGEEATQLLFTGIAKHYCKANNIDISKEANLGRGPVDFKFSQGYRNRVLIEVKLARNSKFWDGLGLQLPKYLEVEEIKFGYFVIVCYTEKDFSKLNGIQDIIINVCKVNNIIVKFFIIDATPNKPSASNL
jgi:hypothetical protein